jgi:Uma2 family endonuclease
VQVAYQLQFEPDAYLAWETDQTEKHEYWNGEVYAMGGARREHVVVSLNIATALKQRLNDVPPQMK